MKRLCFLLMAVLFTVAVSAKKNYDFAVDGIFYRIIDNTNTVAVAKDDYHSSYKGDVVIPETVSYKKKTYTVVRIGDSYSDNNLFQWNVTSVKLPKTIKVISCDAFRTSSITSLELPENLESLDTGFPQSLKHVVIPSNVKYIGSQIFSGKCQNIEISPNNPYYTYGNYALCKLTENGKELVAYNHHNSLRTYRIDSDVVKICAYAFKYGNNVLRELYIPASVKRIERNALKADFWKMLTKIVFEGNTYVEETAFGYYYEDKKPYYQGTIVMPKEMGNSFITYDSRRSNSTFSNGMSKAKVVYVSQEDVLKEKANKGDISAMLVLSKKYEKGDGVSKNPREGAIWLEKAASAGDVESMLAMARKYRYGVGNAVYQNTGMAIKWYSEAANKTNDADIMNTIAYLYHEQKNYSEAYKWYLKAAENGNLSSAFYLGLYNQNAYGTQKNYAEAVRWYKKTLQQDFKSIPTSTYWNLGLIYEYGGYGVEKDPEMALTYYHQAADTYSDAANIKKAQDKCDKLYAQGYREKITLPAMLAIVDGSLQFSDANSNRAIDANETAYLRFKVQNKGKGNGLNCKAIVNITGDNASISAKTVELNTIRPGEQREVSIPITAGLSVRDGKVVISAQVDEEGGFGTQPIELTVATRAYEAPLLKIVDYAASSESGSISKGSPFALQVLLQNTKSGRADDVEVKVSVPSGVFITSENQHLQFGSMAGGKAETLNFEMIASNKYTAATIPVKVTVKEKYGKFAESKTIDLALNQTVAANKISLTPVAQDKREPVDIQIASIGSAVDKNIPVSTKRNENTFVVIIANENYQSVAKVPYAINDGRVFAQYCEKTLGIPASNIELLTDATLNVMRKNINWLTQIADRYNGEARLILYYAGHGIPDEASKSAYLLPVDGYGTDVQTGYKVDDLYAALGSHNAKSVTVFLDACFSGTKREGDMLASARGVAIKAKSGAPQGNMVVFSAATGDETAYPNNDEGHGMFTYYLLKKLQETAGDVTYEELGEYLRTQVGRQSIVINKKSQTPTVVAAPAAEGWQNWQLK